MNRQLSQVVFSTGSQGCLVLRSRMVGLGDGASLDFVGFQEGVFRVLLRSVVAWFGSLYLPADLKTPRLPPRLGVSFVLSPTISETGSAPLYGTSTLRVVSPTPPRVV